MRPRAGISVLAGGGDGEQATPSAPEQTWRQGGHRASRGAPARNRTVPHLALDLPRLQTENLNFCYRSRRVYSPALRRPELTRAVGQRHPVKEGVCFSPVQRVPPKEII